MKISKPEKEIWKHSGNYRLDNEFNKLQEILSQYAIIDFSKLYSWHRCYGSGRNSNNGNLTDLVHGALGFVLDNNWLRRIMSNRNRIYHRPLEDLKDPVKIFERIKEEILAVPPMRGGYEIIVKSAEEDFRRTLGVQLIVTRRTGPMNQGSKSGGFKPITQLNEIYCLLSGELL